MLLSFLSDLRTALEDTDYGTFLQDEPSPLQVSCYHNGVHCGRFPPIL